MTESYRPSNGSEGDSFMAQFCQNCARSNFEDNTKRPCIILGRMMGFGVDDPLYPKELIEDDKGPRCTAFIPDGEKIPEPRCTITSEMFGANGEVLIKPLPKGKFKVIYADPAWNFSGGKKGRPQHYPRMKLSEIMAMPVKDLADDDCWLFIWTTGPHMEQCFKVINAWGFKYSGMGFTWIKLNARATSLFFTIRDLFMGGGYTTRKNAEFCLLAKRGKPKRISKAVHEVMVSPRREHSRKPDEFYDRIEAFCEGPRVELFARNRRPGWEAWGNQTDKFPEVKTELTHE